ncbi:SAM-dependent methyltransferase [Nonomuraea typhae]|uniref:SAM-dependent methyltransferase n=1 Tax=Nonomuraea typhae TaxID=2603600 RepID=A0ABW7Z6T1_9ACTN
MSISTQQVDFAREQAGARGVDDRVRFHFRNMLDTGFPTAGFNLIWTNETTMYVDLPAAFGEFSRMLRPGGRYVCVTGAYDDTHGIKAAAVTAIDRHYELNVHPRSAYFAALAANHLVPIKVADLTADALPYWQLREQCPDLRTGVEEHFLQAFREGSMHYLLIVADHL